MRRQTEGNCETLSGFGSFSFDTQGALRDPGLWGGTPSAYGGGRCGAEHVAVAGPRIFGALVGRWVYAPIDRFSAPVAVLAHPLSDVVTH